MTASDSERPAPSGLPFFRQRWENLLFLHWPVEQASLRPRIPKPLVPDLYDRRCWIGITPFAMRDIAPTGIPSLPLLGRSLELNVRTYVRLGGEPGIWFFSLDVQNPLMLLGARTLFGLPYFGARMRMREEGEGFHFTSRRLPGVPPAFFEARWRPAEPLPPPRPGGIEYFLVERYALFALRGGRLIRARVQHPPWTLRRAALENLVTDLPQVHGLPLSEHPEMVHGQGDLLKVRIWPPRPVSDHPYPSGRGD